MAGKLATRASLGETPVVHTLVEECEVYFFPRSVTVTAVTDPVGIWP